MAATDEEDYFMEVEQTTATTTRASAPRDHPEGAALLFDLNFVEAVLIILCGTFLATLLLSLAYFYLSLKWGFFSDNPWYKRRTYYAVSTSTQNPARCFNLFTRDRPNTLSLSGNITTPTVVVVPIPTMDAAVGDDKVYDRVGSRKRKIHKSKSKLHASESMSKYRLAAMSNAIAPTRESSFSKSSARKHRSKKSSPRHDFVNTTLSVADEISSDESAAYVTPPQDLPRSKRDKLIAARAHRR